MFKAVRQTLNLRCGCGVSKLMDFFNKTTERGVTTELDIDTVTRSNEVKSMISSIS